MLKCFLCAFWRADGRVATSTTLNGSNVGDQAESFQYVPGAGDDEETWSRGLTPFLLWKHTQLLIDAGPAGIAHAVRQLSEAMQSSHKASSNPEASVTAGALLVPFRHSLGTVGARDALLQLCVMAATPNVSLTQVHAISGWPH